MTERVDAVLAWADVFRVRDSSWAALQAAMDLHADHQLQIWDALILAVAAEHRCRILLSEDLQHAFTWRGVTLIVIGARAKQQHLTIGAQFVRKMRLQSKALFA